jgi:hypothetical protein
MKTHYTFGDEYFDKYPCGTWVAEDPSDTQIWVEVNCRRCLSKKAKIMLSRQEEEKAIASQMGDMVEFFQKQRLNQY